MLKLYVFWGLLALVVVAAVAQLVVQRSRRSDARGARVEAASSGDGERPEAAFDPNATRIHLRAAPAAAPAAPAKRDQAILPPGSSARLVCVGGPRRGDSFVVKASGTTVGRDPGNDIVIADPRVSHRHAWLGIIDRKVVLRDLESTNGTFLNARSDALLHEVVLSPGDTVFFGGHAGAQFRFVVE